MRAIIKDLRNHKNMSYCFDTNVNKAKDLIRNIAKMNAFKKS